MQKTTIFAVTVLSLMLVGCASPKFSYQSPPPMLNASGPSIAVMPLNDSRTNRDMDAVIEKGYLLDVQRAIGDELSSMNLFSSVFVSTNDAICPKTDFQLYPKLYRLDWEIPHYGRLQAEGFLVGFTTGIIGGTVFLLWPIDVYGHSVLEVQLKQSTNSLPLFNGEYSDEITNRMKIAVSDTGTTRAMIMAQAFQKTMGEMKTDMRKNFSKPRSMKSSEMAAKDFPPHPADQGK